MRAFPFPDKIMSREELERDLLYNKIPKGDIESISDRAWETGVAAAKELVKEYGSDKLMEDIAKAAGLTIERINMDNVTGNVRYFSEYYSGRNKIVLYLDSISKWAEKNKLPMKEAEELILSHEYYHFLECTKLGLTSRQYKVPTLRVGKIVLARSGVRALSEIGAHGFSRTFYEVSGRLKNTVAVREDTLLNEAVSSFGFDSKKQLTKFSA